MDHTVFTLQTYHTSLHLVSVHQTASPLTSNRSHLIAVYYSLIIQEDERLTYSGWFTHKMVTNLYHLIMKIFIQQINNSNY